MKIAVFFRIVLSLLCLGIVPLPVSAAADSAALVSIPLSSLNEDRPVQLAGLVSTLSLDLVIPSYTRPNGESWLEIELQPSPLLDMQRSSLTIALNDLPASSLRLADVGTGMQTIQLPADYFHSGTNQLAFTGMLYLTTDQAGLCQNWNDPARWLNIAPGGMLQLGVRATTKQFDLGSFPEVFGDPLSVWMDGGQARTLFVLPDEPQRDDLSAVVSLAYALGAQGLPAAWEPEVMGASAFSAPAAAGRNLVFVNVFPEELGDAPAALKDFVALRTSPWDGQRAALTIADRDRGDGSTPADAFSRPAQKVLLQGSLAYIDSLPAGVPPTTLGQTTFQALGYPDRTVKGVGESSLTYRLFLPYGALVDVADMVLILAHAPELGTSESSITVYINGYSVAGILPNKRSAGTLPIPVSIPTSRLRAGENFIRFTFDLKVDYSSCEKSPDSIWATVLNTSSIHLTLREGEQMPSLDAFPMPFSDNPGALFLLPDQPGGVLLGHTAQLAYQFGAAAMITDLPPAAIAASDFSAAGARANVILAGLPAQNSQIMKLNSLLPQPFTLDGLALQSGFGVYVPEPDEAASVGLVQILPSPWFDDGVLMVVTGLDDQGMDFAWDVLVDSAQWRTFSGNLMIAGSDKRSETASSAPAVTFQSTANVSSIPWIGTFLQSIQPGNFIPAAVSILAALVLVLLVLFILRLKEHH